MGYDGENEETPEFEGLSFLPNSFLTMGRGVHRQLVCCMAFNYVFAAYCPEGGA